MFSDCLRGKELEQGGKAPLYYAPGLKQKHPSAGAEAGKAADWLRQRRFESAAAVLNPGFWRGAYGTAAGKRQGWSAGKLPDAGFV